MEVEVLDISSGKPFLGAKTFIPIPNIAYLKPALSRSREASVRIPHTFLLSTKISFTHLILAFLFELISIASATATAAQVVIERDSCAEIFGRRSMLIYMPVLSGE